MARCRTRPPRHPAPLDHLADALRQGSGCGPRRGGRERHCGAVRLGVGAFASLRRGAARVPNPRDRRQPWVRALRPGRQARLAGPGSAERVQKEYATLSKPGIYRIICLEFCGVGHHLMLSRLVVTAPSAPTATRAGRAGDCAGANAPVCRRLERDPARVGSARRPAAIEPGRHRPGGRQHLVRDDDRARARSHSSAGPGSR